MAEQDVGGGDEPNETDLNIQEQCRQLFESTDYIMEPGVFETIKLEIIALCHHRVTIFQKLHQRQQEFENPLTIEFFLHSGCPETVVDLLCDNFKAVASTANLLCELLFFSGVNHKEVKYLVEANFESLVIKNFDPRKADTIFMQAGEVLVASFFLICKSIFLLESTNRNLEPRPSINVSAFESQKPVHKLRMQRSRVQAKSSNSSEDKTPSWVMEMCSFASWRAMIYKLAEKHPSCLMLMFIIKLIADSGLENEITSVVVAAQQMDVLVKVLKFLIMELLECSDDNQINTTLLQLIDLACFSHSTYVFVQTYLMKLSNDTKSPVLKRLIHEIECNALKTGRDVIGIGLCLRGAVDYPKVLDCLNSMLSKNALNPADVITLHRLYSSSDPPPVELIRYSHFMDLLISSLFDPNGKLNPDHRMKYIELLAYAVSVSESHKSGLRKNINKEEYHGTIAAIEGIISACSNPSEFVPQILDVYKCIRFPVAALGLLHWMTTTLLDLNYFKLNPDPSLPHLLILDEIASHHPLLHDRVMDFLEKLFETEFIDVDVMFQLSLKRTILDRMIHLVTNGFVHRVLVFLRRLWNKDEIDASLVRHFVMEILELIEPPYEGWFVEEFLPLVENEMITGDLKNETEKRFVNEFVSLAKQMKTA